MSSSCLRYTRTLRAIVAVLLVILFVIVTGLGIGVLAVLQKLSKVIGRPAWLERIVARFYNGPVYGNAIAIIIVIWETVVGVEVRLHGSPEDLKAWKALRTSPEPFIVNSHHLASVDWVFISSALARAGSHGKVKFLIKKSFKQLPIIGWWGMEPGGHIWISKDLKVDQKAIAETMAHHRQVDLPFVPVIYPEGTFSVAEDYDTIVAPCRDFIKAKGLAPLDYCLSTRQKGFQLLLDAVDREKFSSIWDLSVAFEGNGFQSALPHSEWAGRVLPGFPNLIQGFSAARAHIHVRRRPLPPKEADLRQWLHDCQVDRDASLKEFHESGSFPGESLAEPLGIVFVLSTMLWNLSLAFGLLACFYLLVGAFICKCIMFLFLGLMVVFGATLDKVVDAPATDKKEAAKSD